MAYLNKIDKRPIKVQIKLWQKIYEMVSQWGERPFPLLFSKQILAEKAQKKIRELEAKKSASL